jgi:hypothetical protein
MKSLLRFVAGSALIAVVVLGIAAVVPPPVEAGPCICPQIYAPVTCDNGKTYPNQCVANCKHAKNCVPTGGGVL